MCCLIGITLNNRLYAVSDDIKHGTNILFELELAEFTEPKKSVSGPIFLPSCSLIPSILLNGIVNPENMMCWFMDVINGEVQNRSPVGCIYGSGYSGPDEHPTTPILFSELSKEFSELSEDFSVVTEGCVGIDNDSHDIIWNLNSLAVGRQAPVLNLNMPESISVSSSDKITLGEEFTSCEKCRSLLSISSDGSGEAKFSGDAISGWTVEGVSPGEMNISVKDNEGNLVAKGNLTVQENAKPSSTSNYLEKKVNILNQTQRIRVYDPSKILPSGTKLNASVVKKHDNIDNTYKIEDVFSYDISLTDENGTALTMPLSKPVELLFEVVDGLDKNDLQAILVKEFEDVEFEEELVSLDGSNWLKIKTEHFSPYALIDVLTDEEEALDNSHEGESEALDKSDDESVNFVPTGDLETSSMIFYSSILLIMSLGILAKLNSKKKELKD